MGSSNAWLVTVASTMVAWLVCVPLRARLEATAHTPTPAPTSITVATR